MELYYTLRNKLSLLLAPMAVFALVSCGSYQYSGYEADGIYGESRPGILEQPEQEATEVRPNSNNSYYKNLFSEQSEMVGEVLESDVFTDVDSYSSNDRYENYSEIGGDVAYVGGNAPWGQDPDTYTVNIYNNGFYGGFYSPWRYGYGFGFPYYGGWYDPYWPGNFWGGYGPYAYGGSRWNIGFGLNFGFGLVIVTVTVVLGHIIIHITLTITTITITTILITPVLHIIMVEEIPERLIAKDLAEEIPILSELEI